MHSGELARLAGVTVRALRHYHQVGVLPEPERRTNGYRSYDVHDLIRVLRIKRLASLGVPLERMPQLLDDAASDGGGLLDELDAEFAAQIQRLTEQRELIARLRIHDAPPDVPPELAPFIAIFAAAGISPDLAKIDRDQSVLLAHLVGEEGLPSLANLYQRISAFTVVPAVTDIVARFDRLGPGSTEEEISALVDSFVDVFGPILEDFTDGSEPYDLTGSATLFDEYTEDVLNEQQRSTLARLVAAFDT
ncbi:MerR family transcriptional regulator [Microbacterium sp. dk485]|uniref:MerR family transcriptional regulator n=1 Tax=Microbacterium TaxID=33882 RepID=UPI00107485DE|nr:MULTISPECIES: MerR family transcriptional regulator [Microbacterium]TFV82268.1 MerR family transcriptional regulator [Microbacterium sp. dk485]TXK20404.1 MerR family transcriptional regulator [Microbacterium wangchenii]